MQISRADGNNPVWYSMRKFAEAIGSNRYERMSWDPITCMLPFGEFKELFDYSATGKISVDETGRTVFEPSSGGQHKYLLVNDKMEEAETHMNALIDRFASDKCTVF